MTTTEPRSRALRQTVAHVARGGLIGTADIVPGISGGTVALIVGIYGRLISNIRAGAGLPVALIRGGPTGLRARAATVEWGFILPLALGIASALVVGAFTIEPLLDAHPQRMRALFAGLVVASLAVPAAAVREWTVARAGLVVGGTVVAFLATGLPPTEVVDPSLWMVFGGAAVAICAMILPGVSGSFILAVLGLYAPSLAAVRGADVVYIAVFVAGAAIGLGLFSRVLEYLLVSHGDSTMALLVGLMAGALRALWPWQGEDRSLLGPTDDAWVIGVLFVVGVTVVSSLIHFSKRRVRP